MPNDDLISRNALLENYDLKNATKYGNKTEEQRHNSYSTLMRYEIADMIMDAPAVDAEPVRHGKWIETYAYGAWHYDCPFCDDGYATKEREKKPVNYCPNCGAKMDKEKT